MYCSKDRVRTAVAAKGPINRNAQAKICQDNHTGIYCHMEKTEIFLVVLNQFLSPHFFALLIL